MNHPTKYAIYAITFFISGCGGGGGGDTAPDPVKITANAGDDRMAPLGYDVVVDGSKTTVSSGSSKISWSFVSVPVGSSLTTSNITDANNFRAKFTPDIVGDYKLSLEVSVGESKSTDTISITSSVAKASIPDSGQTVKIDGVFGADADYHGVPENITDNGNGTLTDNVTKLTWQKKYDGKTYNYYQSVGSVNPTYNLDGPSFIDVCGDLSLGSFSDWRIPSQHEIITVANLVSARGLLWDNLNTWRSETLWLKESAVFQSVSGLIGGRYFFDQNYPVLCVRGPSPVRGNIWDNLDGTYSDLGTGIMWKAPPTSLKTKMLQGAIQECEDLNLANRQDWRLPNLRELHSLSSLAMKNGDIRKKFSGEFWSSTLVGNSQFYAHAVELPEGKIKPTDASLGKQYLCVRPL